MIGEIFVKKLYVGLGGIGCRTLRVFEKETKKSDSVRFLYLDNDVYTENDLPEESFFCFDVNKLIKATPFEYQGIDMDSYFANEFFDADKIELIFVTSSFGDFGSKNLFEIANFISSTILTSNLCRQFSVSIKALVFSHENFCSCFSETENKINELHTVQFLTDCSKRVVKNPNDTSTIDSFTYNYVDIFLITDPEADEEKLFKLFYLNNEELKKLDCSEKFYNSAVSYNEKTTVDEENSSDSVKANDANSATDGYAFISYSSKNQSSADAMRKLFNKNGIDTWMAPYDIPAGSEYAEVLYDALENCSCLVLMLTNNSQNSKWVRSEVDIAVSNGKAVIPVKLEDIELNSSMKTYLAGRQIVPVHVIDEGSYEIQSLLDGVRNFVNTADKPLETKECIQNETPAINAKSQNNTVHKGTDKKKRVIRNFTIAVPLLSFVVGICVLVADIGRNDANVSIEHSYTTSLFYDTTAPQITISEPSFNTGTVEFTVYVEEDSEFLSININNDTVETIGFTAAMEIIDQGRKQILKFSNLQVNSGNCQIILLSGSAKDAENNMSAECSSEIFSLDTDPPRIASIKLKNTDKIIKEGDTAVYSVVVDDNTGVAAVSINKENIVTYGFVADIRIKKTNTNVREITFSNIKFNDSDEKYFVITEGVVADTYGNLNEPSQKIYLKTK